MPLNSDQLVALAHAAGGVRFRCSQERAVIYYNLRDQGLMELDVLELKPSLSGELPCTLLWAWSTIAGLAALTSSREVRRQRLERAQFDTLRRKFAMETEFATLDDVRHLLTNTLRGRKFDK